MKKGILLIVFLIAVAAGGYYLYKRYFAKIEITVHSLVPANAILAYEPGDCKECSAAFRSSALWKLLTTGAEHFKNETDSAFNSIRQLHSTSISLHVTSKDNYNLIFYLRQSDVPDKFIEGFVKKGEYSNRSFKGVVISELKSEQVLFSWITLGNYLICTSTPFLIEDVIRTYNKERPTFFSQNASRKSMLQTVSNDAGDIHIQFDAVAHFMNLFVSNGITKPVAGYARLDVKTEGDNIILNGFTADSTSDKSHLSILKQQSPVPFELKQYISNKTIAVKTIGVSNGNALYQNLSRYQNENEIAGPDSLRKIFDQNNISTQKLFSEIGGHISTCWFESHQSRRFGNVLLIETKNTTVWTDAMDKISAKLSVDSVFAESFGDHRIGKLPFHNFPGKLLAPLIPRAATTYYTSVDNVIVISENLADLKLFLSDIDSGETWGKSIAINQFLRSTFLESTLSWFVDVPRTLDLLSYSIKPQWKNFFKENRHLFRSVGRASFQFSHLNTNFYTQLFVETEETPNDRSVSREYQSNFTAPITALHAVKSHVNRADEILIQDSTGALSLISPEGVVQWSVPLPGLITSEVTQIDFFSNGKLQYFFTTKSRLHLIDRTGKDVAPFPVEVFGSDIEHASVVDYDNSKKYRFLIGETNGDVLMYDREGRELEGWNPKHFDDQLHRPARHSRILGRDYIIAITKGGELFITNRRGENVKNFPIKLGTKANGDYFVDVGGNVKDTRVVIVTDDGYKIKIDLEGRVVSKEALLKTSVLTNFSLVNEKTSKSYVILQHDKENCNILDENGKLIVSAGPGINNPKVSYYDFGAGRSYFVITDPVQILTYVYNGQGQLVVTPPFDAHDIVIRPLQGDELRIFMAQDKALRIQNILP
ncbi:MAG TPA: hypothetical protein VD927_14390 [Chryseosolibacter sp.]|nr:hypothetical protein [Chryseosolibacter sp.]